VGQPPLPARGSGGAEPSQPRHDEDAGPATSATMATRPAEAAEAALAPPPAPAASGRPEASRSLYIGKLHPSVNEAMLLEIFSTLGAVQEVKVIRDKLTSLSAGYGFVTYYDPR